MREPGMVILVGLLAALPVVVSTVRALAVGWVPIGDDAIIASRAYDVFTTHSPLLGQYSAVSANGAAVHSLGPMLYWLLALPARLGPWALVTAAGLVNVLSILGVVVLARRRGGDVLMLATGAAVAAMCWSFTPDSLHDIWNPSLALMPFALLVFVAWSVSCGDHRLLPLMAVLASFVVQCHLTFVLPTVGLTAIAAAGLLARRPRAALPGVRRSLVIAAVLTLVCWSAPLLEQALHRPGNLVQVVRTARADRGHLGARAGAYAAVHTVGIPPTWLQRAGRPAAVLEDVRHPPPAASWAAALAVLGLLAWIALAALRRGARDVAAAAGIALMLTVALALVAASTPTADGLFISVGYTLRWGSVAGMFAWLTCAWGAVALARPALLQAEMEGRRAWMATGAVALIALAVAAGTRADVFEPRYDAARTVARAVRPLGGGRAVVVRAPLNQFDLQAAAVYALRRRGQVRMPPFESRLGRAYRELPGDSGPVVRIGVPGAGRVIARVPDESIAEHPPDRPPPSITVRVGARR
jgi:hypothetical protein